MAGIASFIIMIIVLSFFIVSAFFRVFFIVFQNEINYVK